MQRHRRYKSTPTRSRHEDRDQVAKPVTEDYRRSIYLIDDGRGINITPEAKAETPEATRQRRERHLVEIELRLACVHVERNTLYAKRQAHRINDESLRKLVSELDLTEISLGKRLAVVRESLGD